MTDHANEAAATAAGWIKVQGDRGVGKSPRFTTEFSKPLTGGGATGGSGTNIVGGRGESDVNAATADAQALVSLNGFRKLHYSAGAGAGQDNKGGSHTFDLT